MAIAGGLWWFWNRQGLLREGSAWLEASLNCPPQEDPPNDRYRQQRARALNGAGSLATEQGDFDAALRYHQEGLALRRALGDQAGAADILHNLALTARCQGDFTQALQWFEESLGEMVKLGHAPESDVMNYANIGITHFEMGNLALAQPWLETALVSARSQNDGWRAAFVAANLADLLLAQGDLSRAERLAQESVQEFERLGDQLFLAEALLVLAQGDGPPRGVPAGARAVPHRVRTCIAASTIGTASPMSCRYRPGWRWRIRINPRGETMPARCSNRPASLRTAVPRALAPYEQAEYERLRSAVGAPTTI